MSPQVKESGMSLSKKWSLCRSLRGQTVVCGDLSIRVMLQLSEALYGKETQLE